MRCLISCLLTTCCLGAQPFSIQDAIDAAHDGDEIRVPASPDPYRERIDFAGKSIRVIAWDVENDRPGLPADHVIAPPDDEIGRSVVTMRAPAVSPDGGLVEMVLEGFSIRRGLARQGGGIAVRGGVFAEIYRCEITHNQAVVSAPVDADKEGLGGGIFVEATADVTVLSCALAYNHADGQGGAIYMASAGQEPRAEGKLCLVNCTVLRNRSVARTGAAVFLPRLARSPCILNNIVWGNLPENDTADMYSEDSVTGHCNLLGVAPGVICETCIAGDPAFLYDIDSPTAVAPPLGRFRLGGSSPGIDQGCDPSSCLSRPFSRPLEYADINGRLPVGERDVGVDEYFIIFVRADSNVDTTIDQADPIFILQYLFRPGSPFPDCPDAADTNDDGRLNLADGIYALSFLWANGPPPPVPFPMCGEDPTEDQLGCDYYPDPPNGGP
jgi:hypothetical protein